VKTVEIVLDRQRNLRYTVKALRHLQRMSGMPLRPFAAMLGETSIEGYCQALAAGLEHEWPEITLTDAETLLQWALDNGPSLKAIAEKITEAFVASGLFEPPKNPTSPGVTPAGRR
jgi:hypothetical protein